MSDLEELQLLFHEPDAEIQARRNAALKTLRENNAASFPSDISLLSAFDEVLQCFALGGQVRHYYRYGSYTTCQDARDKFWFAMWNGTLREREITENVDARELERRRKVQDFYKQRLLRTKAMGSSEDVWDERRIPARPFTE